MGRAGHCTASRLAPHTLSVRHIGKKGAHLFLEFEAVNHAKEGEGFVPNCPHNVVQGKFGVSVTTPSSIPEIKISTTASRPLVTPLENPR